MRIQNNIESLNAYRNLNNTNRAMSRSLERLSSGFRINRAADDAAGLAISEKMRSQIRGLNQAVSNAQDGISLIQTAEGALNETHSILQSMRELAAQSANDTYTDEDRAAIQQDIDQLVAEITRIGDTTEFNTENLLDGSFSGSLQIGANSGQTMDISIGDMTAAELLGGTEATDPANAEWDGTIGSTEVTITGGESADYNVAIDFVVDTDATEIDASYEDGTITVTLHEEGDFGSDAIASALNDLEDFEGFNVDYEGDISHSDLVATDDIQLTGGTAGAEATAGGIDVGSRETAGDALDTLDAAIQTVSTQRSELGALQNRLEHTITNLEVAAENLTAAESRIRDVDMAAEMTEFTKNQILTQAGTAMLAQANMAPQAVLQLLG